MIRIMITAALSIFATSHALAADLPQPPPPPPQSPATYVPVVAPVYNWGGIYVGINGGYGFGTSNWTDPLNTSGSTSTGDFSTNGGLVGGTVGANYQADVFVFGVEADMDWQGLSGTSTSSFCVAGVSAISVGAPSGFSCKTESDWLATLRGRAGYAADRVLFYATAGGAFGAVRAGLSGLSLQSNIEIGWTAGAGVEFAFADNWTAKLEYLYVDLGNSNCNQVASCGFEAGTAVAANDAVNFTENIIRVGVNFKFRP